MRPLPTTLEKLSLASCVLVDGMLVRAFGYHEVAPSTVLAAAAAAATFVRLAPVVGRRVFPRLVSINLSDNELSDDALPLIAAHCTALRTVDLTCNPISQRGIVKFPGAAHRVPLQVFFSLHGRKVDVGLDEKYNDSDANRKQRFAPAFLCAAHARALQMIDTLRWLQAW